MEVFSEFLDKYPGLWEKVGFYTFFFGIFILVAIIVPLLFERERWLLPSIILSILLVSAMAWTLEHTGPLFPEREILRIVYLTRTVEVPVEVPVMVEPPKRTTRPRSTPTKKPKKQPSRTETPAPSTPKREPPVGERTEEGLILPTGTLVIKVTSSLIMVVPKVASKATMGIYVDGKYVSGRGASKLRKQKDEEGNLLNVTYVWSGTTIRLTNRTTGNHRITVKLRVSGNGVSKSRTAWSGTVYVGENKTTTIVLKGGFGETLTRVQ